MAPKQANFANTDFANLHNSVTELMSAQNVATDSTPGGQGVRKTTSTTAEEAKKTVRQDLLKLMQSPLNQTPRSGFGGLKEEAIGPIRELYKKVQ